MATPCTAARLTFGDPGVVTNVRYIRSWGGHPLTFALTVSRFKGDVPFLFRPPPMDEYPQKTASRNPFSKGSDKKVRW